MIVADTTTAIGVCGRGPKAYLAHSKYHCRAKTLRQKAVTLGQSQYIHCTPPSLKSSFGPGTQAIQARTQSILTGKVGGCHGMQ
jgi:hypothetical protein